MLETAGFPPYMFFLLSTRTPRETQNNNYNSQHPLQLPVAMCLSPGQWEISGRGAHNFREVSPKGESIPFLPAFLLPASGNAEYGQDARTQAPVRPHVEAGEATS